MTRKSLSDASLCSDVPCYSSTPTYFMLRCSKRNTSAICLLIRHTVRFESVKAVSCEMIRLSAAVVVPWWSACSIGYVQFTLLPSLYLTHFSIVALVQILIILFFNSVNLRAGTGLQLIRAWRIFLDQLHWSYSVLRGFSVLPRNQSLASLGETRISP